MGKMDKKMHLVSHVHWDPAWYLPYEKYRIILVKLMKKLLHILDQNLEYHSFMFDGQVDAIDDYLEIMPEDKARIEKHVKSGRLIIGPWYIQPEEFLISGETHIRNLLLGIKRAKELGGEMPVSYLCDMVGHIAQMPQIIKGFGIDYFVGWRGIIDGKERDCSELIWEAPDGSKVLLKVLVDSYYNLLPDEEQGFCDKIDEMKKSLSPFAQTDYILIMQGADHREPIENIPELIKGYNQRAGYKAIEHTNLFNHFKKMQENANNFKLFRGEMRAFFRPHSFILTGILTARMSIKLENERISRDLERWMEPFAALDSILNGTQYPKAFIDYIWRKQLKNSFHDCIYGAHVDEVTLDIQNDYKRESEIIEWLNSESLYNLTKSIKTAGRDCNVTIFNPTPWDRENAVVDFMIFMEEDKISKEFVLIDSDGNYLPLQISDVTPYRTYSGFSGNQWEQNDGRVGNLYSLSTVIPCLPALGYCNLDIIRLTPINQDNTEYCKRTNKRTDLLVHLNQCENQFLLVKIKENGLLDVYDKQADTWYHDLNMLEDSGDAGDLYNFSVPHHNRIYYDCFDQARVSLLENGPTKVVYQVERDWLLPIELSSEGGRSEEVAVNQVITKITLRSHAKSVEIHTKIQNCVKDHRIRAVFPTSLACMNAHSGSQFYVSERATEMEELSSYIEEPMGNQPQRLFVDISDGHKGVSFISRGLPEYEAKPNGDLFITLLRCSGSLSKDNLKERSYCNAGPMYKTPLAQELGWQTFDYALYFHKGTWQEGQSYRYCDEFYAPPRAMQSDAHEGELALSGSFVKTEGEGVMLSALKKAEQADNWVIRLYNVLDRVTECSIQLIKPIKNAYYTDLNEMPIEKLSIADGKVVFSIKPNQIYTIMAEL